MVPSPLEKDPQEWEDHNTIRLSKRTTIAARRLQPKDVLGTSTNRTPHGAEGGSMTTVENQISGSLLP